MTASTKARPATRRPPAKSPADRAYERGHNGGNLTDAQQADPALVEAHTLGKSDQAAGLPKLPPSTRSAGPPDVLPEPKSEPGPGPTAKASRAPMFSPQTKDLGGTGGGLLLALIAYPVGLNVIKYGPSGAVLWFKAKFLNKVQAAAPKTVTTNPGQATIPVAPSQTYGGQYSGQQVAGGATAAPATQSTTPATPAPAGSVNA